MTPRQEKDNSYIESRGGLERVNDINNYLIQSGIKTQRQDNRKDDDQDMIINSISQTKTERRRS